MKTIVINDKPTQYQIDEQGNVYNTITKKFLQGNVYNTGYKMVNLTIDKKKKGYAVHRLVAEAFLDNPNNLPVVNHIDGNKNNNCVNNLEWVSYSENTQHCYNNNLTSKATGKRTKVFIEEDGINWKRYCDTNYLVSKQGEVYNTKTNILLKQSVAETGYIRYSLRIDGKTKSKLAHKLVVQTWIDNNYDEKTKVINHIDGNKSNNDINNLEIISKAENMNHACYTLKKVVKPVKSIDQNGIITEYPSVVEAARQNNVTDGAIRFALKNNSKSCGCYWEYI